VKQTRPRNGIYMHESFTHRRRHLSLDNPWLHLALALGLASWIVIAWVVYRLVVR